MSRTRTVAVAVTLGLALTAGAQDEAKTTAEVERAADALAAGKLDEADKALDALLARKLEPDDRRRALALRARARGARAGSRATPAAERKALLEKALAAEKTAIETAADLDEAFEARARRHEVLLAKIAGLAGETDALGVEALEAAALAVRQAREEVEALEKAEKPEALAGARLALARAELARASLLPETEERTKLLRGVTARLEALERRTFLQVEAAVDAGDAWLALGEKDMAVQAWLVALSLGRLREPHVREPKLEGLPRVAWETVARATLRLGVHSRGSTPITPAFLRQVPDHPLATELRIEREVAVLLDPKAVEKRKGEARSELQRLAKSSPRAAAALAAAEGGKRLDPLPDRELAGRRRGSGPKLTDAFALPRYGSRGKPISKEADPLVEQALRWLARHQGEDGSFTIVGEVCSPKGTCRKGSWDDEGYGHSVGLTGLALLAYLGAGHGPSSDRTVATGRTAGQVVARGLDALVKWQDASGAILLPKLGATTTDHAIATLALVEAYAMTGRPSLRLAAQKAVNHIVMAQNYGLGWRYQVKPGRNDTFVTTWCLAALVAARAADLDVPETTFEGAKAWVNRVTDGNGQVGYDRLGSSELVYERRFEGQKEGEGTKINPHFAHHFSTHGAAAIAVRSGGRELILKRVKDWMTDLPRWSTETPRPVDLCWWFWGSEGLFAAEGAGGPRYQKWSAALATQLAIGQRPGGDGCLAGSWDADADRWGWSGGRIYVTAMAALALETPRRSAEK